MNPQVTCVGETMLLLTATEAVPLDQAPSLSMGVAGAESNVACGLAALGHGAAWLSAVGDDPFGRLLVRHLGEAGVDVSGTRVDPGRPTGLLAKDPSPTGSTVHYYRAGSAASALGPDLADHPHIRAAATVHLSGITPALSPTCDALTEHLLRSPETTVSFDVNHRPRLWRRGEAAPRLLELARLADLVFVGRDEAEELWGTHTARDVRDLLPDVDRLVVKDAEHGATEFGGEGETYVPAPRVEVVEPVGAGDAFAAGYLAADLRGLDARGRLRLGHLCAGRVLRVTGDLAAPPPPERLDALLAVPDRRWTERASAAVAAVRGDEHE
ncbi:sugar kinase [Nocardiopsis sp. MG754419]|uniref:sugar kinase n=1 Tax=Nocardiopsis sp. MG754419 TaxID=2259865 RepID=UPI001BADA712|nr:sugar kinase [Nocardiopsis sp. MG754419]MBR8743188.1 sugar kinase [Nocardiopsis sp. MG754419]